MSPGAYKVYQNEVWTEYLDLVRSEHSLEPGDVTGVDISTAESLEKTIEAMQESIRSKPVSPPSP